MELLAWPLTTNLSFSQIPVLGRSRSNLRKSNRIWHTFGCLATVTEQALDSAKGAGAPGLRK